MYPRETGCLVATGLASPSSRLALELLELLEEESEELLAEDDSSPGAGELAWGPPGA